MNILYGIQMHSKPIKRLESDVTDLSVIQIDVNNLSIKKSVI